MSSNSVDRIASPNVPAPSHLGQATAVEQSRAVAEVQAAVVVAQQRPRSIQTALAEMEQSCRVMAMAERAFYRYNRGGTNVTGPSVHLMRELARCFGNLQYGIAELRRDDDLGFSEMQAFAWDVQTNTRSAQIFVVPHKRDKRGGAVALSDLRDIYENNANQGSRRLREAIRSVLPPWFVEKAVELCNQTLKDGGGVPLAQRISQALAWFEQRGVTSQQIEAKLGRKADAWTPQDVAQLSVIMTSLHRGETTVEEEFPDEQVTGAEITQNKGSEPAVTAEQPEAETPAETPGERKITQPQSRKLHALFREAGISDRDEQLAYLSAEVGHDVTSSSELTSQEASIVIDVLSARAKNEADQS